MLVITSSHKRVILDAPFRGLISYSSTEACQTCLPRGLLRQLHAVCPEGVVLLIHRVAVKEHTFLFGSPCLRTVENDFFILYQ